MTKASGAALATAGSDFAFLSGLVVDFVWLDRLLARAVAAAETAYGQEGGAALSFRGLCINRAEVERLLGQEPGTPLLHVEEGGDRVGTPGPFPNSPPLLWLQKLFGLSSFDLQLMIVALAPELDLRYERLYGYLQDDVTRRRPTADLALNLVCASAEEKLARRAHLAPEAPLVRHGLLHLVSDPNHVQPPFLAHYLKLDDQVVRCLLGQGGLDPRLASFCELGKRAIDSIVPLSNETIQRALTRLALRFRGSGNPLRLYFRGPHGAGKHHAAEVLASVAGAPLLTTDLLRASAREDFEGTLKLIFKEARLQEAILYLEGLDSLSHEERTLHRQSLMQTIANHKGITVLSGAGPLIPARNGPPDVVTVSFLTDDFALRRMSWQTNLASAGIDPDAHDLDALSSRFRLTPGQIVAAVAAAGSIALWRAVTNSSSAPHGSSRTSPTTADFFAAARAQSGHDLGRLACKLEPKYTWDDIVLPGDQTAQLLEICAQAKLRQVVYGQWGFERKLSLGKGLNVLFSGPPGTGKTMAAEVIANELQVDAYKIDLSQVVSKYIGETEKNLDRIFSAAETSNAILFFDEADALFGKRSEVRDAHDRYANIEIGYLLQKMEEYKGVAILATNLRQNLDEAFVRRLQAIVEFPFPDEEHRRRIWAVIFPREAPLNDDVDFDVLAREVKLAGGSIKNIALASAFYAAADCQVIRMAHLVRAARREHQKLGRSWNGAV